jgi:glycosyltransferase involved in cell wall biosynthesis
MKILHLSTSDVNGGAARAAFRLHSGLIQKGIDSQIFVRDKLTENKSVIRYKYPKGLGKARYRLNKYRIDNDFRKYTSTRPAGLEVFSDDRAPLKAGFSSQLPNADIYNLHWISGFVDLPEFFRNINKPVVWTLHDMFPFTGGCHYNNGCENYITNCHFCPQLGSLIQKDLSYYIWKRKNKSLTEFKNKITIRADSHWLAGEARKSSIFRDMDIDVIHYGIETDEFLPRDKHACLKSLKIPEKSRVIVFGAPGINNPRKGFFELSESLKQLKNIYPGLFLLSFGSGTIPADTDVPKMHLGNVANNNLLSLIYNCADVFVIPSLEEAFGQTALEAMSCGIPVVGFKTGGIPDMIQDGITGYLAEKGNVTSLADSIKRVLNLNEKEYQDMAKNCREKVLKGFTLELQAEKYLNIYKKLI